MSNDLISRKELIKEIEKSMNKNEHTQVDIRRNHRNEHMHFLNIAYLQPVAYDVDGVVEKVGKRIEEAKRLMVDKPQDELDKIANDTCEAFIAAYTECIDIVKEGGV